LHNTSMRGDRPFRQQAVSHALFVLCWASMAPFAVDRAAVSSSSGAAVVAGPHSHGGGSSKAKKEMSAGKRDLRYVVPFAVVGGAVEGLCCCCWWCQSWVYRQAALRVPHLPTTICTIRPLDIYAPGACISDPRDSGGARIFTGVCGDSLP